MSPDRSHDVPPPDDRSETRPCSCGKRMVGCIDESGMRNQPPVMRWFWFCGGCNIEIEGGKWHPLSRAEVLMRRWCAANAIEFNP